MALEPVDIFPYELKRLIYDASDLSTLKALRCVSKAWASVGADLLLLPTFSLRSYAHDLSRLLSISRSAVVGPRAAHTVSTLIFQSNGWDPRYFRNIVCNRHELRREYETLDFVPTEAEQQALAELDAVAAQHDLDEKLARDEERLVRALQAVPHVHSITIACENPFRHRLLRKVWDEYALAAYHRSVHPQTEQLWRILRAARSAGLHILHFRHQQLLSPFFLDDALSLPPGALGSLSRLHSLHLDISDLAGVFSRSAQARDRLRDLIASAPLLTTLSISFESLDTVPLTFLPLGSSSSKLHTLTLSSPLIHPPTFLSYLSSHPSLTRLRLRSASLTHGSWHAFLSDLRSLLGAQLQAFQLSGVLRGAEGTDGEGETWMLWPFYDEEWRVMEGRGEKASLIERFVIKGEKWPMGLEHGVAYL
jgi:hypothetical protein